MTVPHAGGYPAVKSEHGVLREYSAAPKPLELRFEFNPTTITRSRTVTIKTGSTPGTRGGYDFANRTEAPRASQGVTVNAETFTLKILLDAADRMGAGDPVAISYGIQPELDVLRSMLEPKIQTKDGVRTLAALGKVPVRAFSRHEYASVLQFVWGKQTLPVFMTQVTVEAKEYLPNLFPYRAEVSLTLQVIESRNDMYEKELKRQFASAGQVVS